MWCNSSGTISFKILYVQHLGRDWPHHVIIQFRIFFNYSEMCKLFIRKEIWEHKDTIETEKAASRNSIHKYSFYMKIRAYAVISEQSNISLAFWTNQKKYSRQFIVTIISIIIWHLSSGLSIIRASRIQARCNRAPEPVSTFTFTLAFTFNFSLVYFCLVFFFAFSHFQLNQVLLF
jgi:hypothetical protein